MKPSEDRYLVSPSHARGVLLLLFALMAFDFIDRQVLAALLPEIKRDWHLSDTELGLLVGAVNLSIAVLALPIAVLVDRWSRSYSIGAMAIVWSLATAACALAANFHHLLAARVLIGAGEAGYASGGSSLLAAVFPRRLRATVIGIFNSAALIGSVLGLVLGGLIAQAWGWRSAFGVVALPGLLLGLLMFFVRDYRSVAVQARDPGSGALRALRWRELPALLLRSPVLLLIFLGHSAQLFFAATLGSWLPSFFRRSYGLGTADAGLHAAAIMLVAALGVALGGWVVDRLANGSERLRLSGAAGFALMSAIGNLLAFSLAPGPAQMALLFAGALFMAAMLGPVSASLVEFVHPGLRSTVLGAAVMTTNLFGMALGPAVAGLISDRSDLRSALLVISAAPLLAALGYGLAARRYERGRLARAEDCTLTAA